MAFRADEEAKKGLELALRKLVPRDGSPEERAEAEAMVIELVEEFGPVVQGYPSWHPLVNSLGDKTGDYLSPREECGYKNLDHNVLLAKAFITCPYQGDDEVIESVENLPRHPAAEITAEPIDAPLYSTSAKPVLVKCDWYEAMDSDGTVPKELAAALMLEKEIPSWRTAQVAESWNTMQPYFLGSPHGARSSLFISQEAGQAMKTMWNAVIKTGMFGPVRG